MGGSVEVASELGQGSTFTLRLPLELLAPVQPRDALPPVRPAAPDPEAPANLQVLAAEDNPINQMVLKTLLEPAGIAPTMVINGAEAVAAWERQKWDLVLMDIQMPGMNGLEAARAIRRRELETGRSRTPIVAVTANAMSHQVVQYREVGMDGVVAKPVNITSLYEAMEQALT